MVVDHEEVADVLRQGYDPLPLPTGECDVEPVCGFTDEDRFQVHHVVPSRLESVREAPVHGRVRDSRGAPSRFLSLQLRHCTQHSRSIQPVATLRHEPDRSQKEEEGPPEL